MTKFNYQNICSGILLKDLPEKNKEVLIRRFGLTGERETLETIGQDFGITRERVRQIEADGLKKLEEKLKSHPCQNVFNYFVSYLKRSGSLKREDLLLSELGGDKLQNHVYFLLTLGNPFLRFNETESFYSFWTVDKNAVNLTQKNINTFIAELKKKNRLLVLPAKISPSYFEVSKYILKGQDGRFGLREWPEVNPRGIKDMAYIIFKKEKTPLHFTQVAQAISKETSFPTVHNELIKDPRFVLVGRGLYALREWGYQPGVVREVIARALEKVKKPMKKEQILKKVLEQRQIKANTILLNLQNKKYFIKNSEGKYFLRKA